MGHETDDRIAWNVLTARPASWVMVDPACHGWTCGLKMTFTRSLYFGESMMFLTTVFNLSAMRRLKIESNQMSKMFSVICPADYARTCMGKHSPLQDIVRVRAPIGAIAHLQKTSNVWMAVGFPMIIRGWRDGCNAIFMGNFFSGWMAYRKVF